MLAFILQWRDDFLALIASKRYTVNPVFVKYVGVTVPTTEAEANRMFLQCWRFMRSYETVSTSSSGVEGLRPDTLTLRSLAVELYGQLPTEFTLGAFTDGDFTDGLNMLGQRASWENGGTLEGVAIPLMEAGMVFRGRTNNSSMQVALKPSNNNVFEFFFGATVPDFEEDFANPAVFDLEVIPFNEEELVEEMAEPEEETDDGEEV